jgi:hypothetical protein
LNDKDIEPLGFMYHFYLPPKSFYIRFQILSLL